VKPHETLDDEARDRAALHALGSLPEAERREYEAHLAACAACRREVEGYGEVVRDLALAAPAAEPPSGLRGRLLHRIRGPEAAADPRSFRLWRQEPRQGAFVFEAAADAVWEPGGAAGVEARRLYVDEAADRVTMLIRMAPGASYPRHRHAGPEECYVVEGDLLVGKRRMRAGDYQRAEPGSVHGVQSTEGGCLLLIVSSLHDELLPHAAV
jgi:putative transcriptional regulator